jgi:hypothetical protein
MIEACGFRSEDRAAKIGELLHWRGPANGLGPCLVLPFFDADGTPTGYVRAKPDHPRTDKEGKPVKYESPKGQPNPAYFPPGFSEKYTDSSSPLLITEGEKKSAKAVQEGFACLGLVGVYGWQRRREKDSEGHGVGPRELIPDLEALAWAGRQVFIAFDSDAVEKAEVRWAERHLAEVLATHGARVRLVRLPPGPGGEKAGLDDFLVANGPEALRELLAQALEPDPWPDPLPFGDAPVVPAFPLDVFPEQLRRVPAEIAAAMACPADYAAVPLLAMAGGVLGTTRSHEIKPGHRQRANIFAAVVGPPGVLKTPAQDQIAEPLRQIEATLRAEWKGRLKEHEALEHAYDAVLKEWKKDRKGDPPEKPERPPLERLTVDDATVEALAAVLGENPRGVTLVKDELVGLVLALNQYREGGKGSDRQFYLSCWSGVDYTVDRRKGHELGPLYLSRPFLAVVGGLTPDRLPILRGDRPNKAGEQDGFLDRFLFSFPIEPQAQGENWLQINPETVAVWAEVVKKLRTLEMVPIQEGEDVRGWRPYFVRLSPDGRDAWQTFTHSHAAEVNAEGFPECLRGPWSKLRGYCGRLALVLHYLRWACGEVEGDKSDVDGESVRRAEVLIDYFKAHARRVYSLLDADPRAAPARRLLHWVAQANQATFTKRDAYRALRGPRCRSVEDVDPVLALLEQHGHIRRLLSPGRHGPGRHPSPGFEAHPSILLGPNGHNGGNASAEGSSVHSVHCVPGGEESGENDVAVWEGEVQ